MSNWIKTILSITIITLLITCDTKETVKPRGENFFYKVYAGVSGGDHIASSIIETSDGGLLIACTSIDQNDNPIEIVLIKTDKAGDLEWKRGYADLFAEGFTAEAKVVLESPNGFVVGGVYDSLAVRHSILFNVNSIDGTPLGAQFRVNSKDSLQADYLLSNVSLGPSGLLVAGTTNQVTDDEKGGTNGFIQQVSVDLNNNSVNIVRQIFGISGNEEVVGAFEVTDPGNIGGQGSQYLVFGTTTGSTLTGNSNFFYQGFFSDFREATSLTAGIIADGSGVKRGSKVVENNGDYWMIGDRNLSEIYLIGWRFTNSDLSDWTEINGFGNISVLPEPEIGKSIAFGPQGKVILSDVIYSPDHTEISIASLGGDSNVDSGWPLTFGNSTSTYEAADVIVLSDGSVVTLGTADLEPIRKIVVIKTGPNGEMSF